MIDGFYVDSQSSELIDQLFDFLFMGISPHIAQFSVFIAAENEIDNPRKSICNSDFCLVGRAESEDQLIVFGPVKRASFHLCAVGSLNEESPEVGIAWSTF